MRSGGEKGFSLIELALALAVIGILTAGALAEYQNYYRFKGYNESEYRSVNVQAALTRFLTMNRRLPCPADPTAPMGSSQAGRENCLGGVSANGCVASRPGADATEGVCRAPGARDGGADNVNGLNEKILVGSIPFATLGIPENESYDGWGSKFIYVVTEAHANPTRVAAHRPAAEQVYNATWGVVALMQYNADTGEDVQGGNTDVPLIVDGVNVGTPLAWSFAFMSVGADKKGGYNRYGVRTTPCTGTGRDVENCDGDATFIDNIYRVDAEGSADYYDDVLMINRVAVDADKWEFVNGVMRNKQSADTRVGIGTDSPDEILEVDGNIRTPAANAARYCSDDPDPADRRCFSASLIGGAGERCSGMMRGIRLGGVECERVVGFTAGLKPGTCPAGKFVQSINPATGEVICQ